MKGDRVTTAESLWDFHRYIAGDGDDGQKPYTWRYQTGPHEVYVNDPHISLGDTRFLTVVCDTCTDLWWTSVPESQVDVMGEGHRSHMADLGRLT